jgi:excisionase family DNA binding protein
MLTDIWPEQESKEETMEYKPLYTVPEVAKILMVNRNYVYGLINEGKLPAIKLGAKKVRGTDLEKFLAECKTVNV